MGVEYDMSSHTLHSAVYLAMNVYALGNFLETACVNVYSSLLQEVIGILVKNTIFLVLSFFETVTV